MTGAAHLIRRMLSSARPILTVTAVAVILLALCGAGRALADGDPASDELIAQNVFYPYSSPVPQSVQRRLNAMVTAAHHSGLFLKIALIAKPSDMGSITALYASPQRYAQFLDTELSLNSRIPLLVVMRDGFGSEGLPAKLQRAVLDTRIARADTGAALTRAAISAVGRMDADLHAGSVGRATASSRSAFGTRTVLLLALILAALVVGGVLIIARVMFPPTA
jgi:hypothetical protein